MSSEVDETAALASHETTPPTSPSVSRYARSRNTVLGWGVTWLLTTLVALASVPYWYSRDLRLFTLLPVPFSSQPAVASLPTPSLREYHSSREDISILSELTSPTFVDVPSRKDISWWIHILGKTYTRPLYPSVILKSGKISPGECWPLSGPRGFVGVDLGQDVHLVNFTVGHDLGTRPSPPSAPKDMMIWGLQDHNTSTNLVDPAQRQFPAHILQGIRNYTPVLLGEMRYENSRPEQLQTFFIRSAFTQDVSFRRLIVEIVDNWGSAKYTCLYSISIQGFIHVP